MKKSLRILLQEIINNPVLQEKVSNSLRLTDQNLINDPLLFDKTLNTPLLFATSVNTPELFDINLRLELFANFKQSLLETLNLSDSRFAISQKINVTDNIASSMKGYAFMRDEDYVEGPYFLQPYVATTPPGNSRQF